MADHSAGEEHEPGERAVSIFSQKIPLEIRHHIYRYVFAGSKIMVFRCTPRNSGSVPPRCLRQPYYSTTHWRVLLVCKQFYEEARPIHGEETVVSFFPSFKVVGDSYLDSEAFTLCVGDYMKAHITHLRHIEDRSLPGTNPVGFLIGLPKLKTLHIDLWLDHRILEIDGEGELSEEDGESNEEVHKRREERTESRRMQAMLRHIEKELKMTVPQYLETFRRYAAPNKITFVIQASFIHVRRQGCVGDYSLICDGPLVSYIDPVHIYPFRAQTQSQTVSLPPNSVQYLYLNMNTGKTFVTSQVERMVDAVRQVLD